MDDFEIILDGDFGFEITYAMYKNQLAEASGKNVVHRINSPGGSVSEATAMRNALDSYMRKYPDAKVSFVVEGWAQSAATYLMSIPGANVTVGADSLYMYHNPASLAFGDHNEMAKQAQFLADLASTYAQAYAARSGKSIDNVRSDMDAETYFIGQAIVDNGFADAVEGESDGEQMRAESVVVEMGRNRFKQTVGRLAAAAWGAQQTKPVPAQPVTDNNQPEDTEMSDKTITETQKPDVSAETARAEAWMTAVQANPKMAEMLKKRFKEGASAEFFHGVAAAVEMAAASKDHGQSENENPPAIKTEEVTTVPVVAKSETTPGMTGELAEV